MLNNATGFRNIYIAAGYTDIRRGIDGLASIVKFNFQLDPYEKDVELILLPGINNRLRESSINATLSRISSQEAGNND